MERPQFLMAKKNPAYVTVDSNNINFMEGIIINVALYQKFL